VRFLIDAQLPPALCEWLRDRGHEAWHVASLGLLAATDATIADRADAENLILITKDDDFLRLRLPDRFVLLWLRVGNATNRALLAWLDPRWSVAERMLETGERLIELR
jgi:predicted nuclease of predicted toxin-antitoxin system